MKLASSLRYIGAVALGLLGIICSPPHIKRASAETTAKPGEQIKRGDMKLIDVRLATKMYRDESENWRSVYAHAPSAPNGPYKDGRVRFRIPKAAVKEQASASQVNDALQIGFELWSDTFDPAADDVVARRNSCGPNDEVCRRQGLIQKQREARGEYRLEFEIGVAAIRDRAEIERLHQNWAQNGRARRLCQTANEKNMVAAFEIPAQDMIIYEISGDASVREKCLLRSTTAWARATPFDGPTGFVKRNERETAKFSAYCTRYNPSPDARSSSRCEIRGSFRQWPLRIFVEAARADEWNHIYDRIITYLDAHLVENIEPAE